MAAGTTQNRDTWLAQNYRQHARFVADMASDLLTWLAPRSGETILDIGCGDGALTRRIARVGAQVTGVDSSHDMATAARGQGLTVHVQDAQHLGKVRALPRNVDAVFSNAALHWMSREPQAVIEHVHALLRPGGRFVAEMGGAGNIDPIRQVLREELQKQHVDPERVDPWYFPEQQVYRRRLQQAGFAVERMHCFERPTPLPGDITAWLTTLARPFVMFFTAGSERQAYIDVVRQRLQDDLQYRGGQWIAPYVRLRFLARKPR